MKGRFTLWNINDAWYFGNLYQEDATLGSVGYLDSVPRIARLVAHDVVEHNIAHRTKGYVTWTDELRALGAALFIRGCEVDFKWDFINMLEMVPDSQLDRLPPYHGNEGNEWWDIMCNEMGEDIIWPKKQWFLQNLSYGYKFKESQFKQSWDSASNAFYYVESMVDQVLKKVIGYDQLHGISFNFDTEECWFKHQYKRQYNNFYYRTNIQGFM